MHGWTLLALDVEAEEPAAIQDDAVAELISWLAGLFGFAEPTRRIRHAFAPQGLSDVSCSEQGRIAIHTWPEWRRATIDVWAPSADVARRLEEVIPLLSTRYRLRVLAVWRPEVSAGGDRDQGRT